MRLATSVGARGSASISSCHEAFEREWADAVAVFRQDVAPAVEAQKAAERQSDEARLAWDRAVASRGKAGAQRGRWTLALREAAAAGSQERWRNLRATEGVVFRARSACGKLSARTKRRRTLGRENTRRNACKPMSPATTCW